MENVNWIIIVLTSTVIAALITAIISLVIAIMNNKAKTSDAVRTFRYTKLHEIMVDWQDDRPEFTLESPDVASSVINHNLELKRHNEKHYQKAKPLVDLMHWGDFEVIWEEISVTYDETTKTIQEKRNFSSELINEFTQKNSSVEERFASAIEKQMRALLK